jgi:hypothetical protein
MAPVVTHSSLSFRSIVLYTTGAFFCGLALLYILFQARFLLAGPQIVLNETTPNPQIARVVVLEGKAQNIVRMTLNGRQIFTDTTGYFNEELILENGYTIATLAAEDRYGRIETITRMFVFLPEETLLDN